MIVAERPQHRTPAKIIRRQEIIKLVPLLIFTKAQCRNYANRMFNNSEIFFKIQLVAISPVLPKNPMPKS